MRVGKLKASLKASSLNMKRLASVQFLCKLTRWVDFARVLAQIKLDLHHARMILR